MGIRSRYEQSLSGPMRVIALVALSAGSVAAQSVITTFAGTDFLFPKLRMPALDAPLGSLGGVTADTSGTVYFVDQSNSLVLRYTQDGIVTIVAGNGFPVYSGDGGPAGRAGLENPRDVAVDAQGTVYIVEFSRIRKIGLDGIITTIAGEPGLPVARLAGASAAAAAPDGSLLVSEGFRIIRISPDGRAVTVAGVGAPAGPCVASGDGGPATAAQLCRVGDLAVDADGRILVADGGAHRVRAIGLDGVIRTVAGTGQLGVPAEGAQAAATPVTSPEGLTPAPDGGFWFSEAGRLQRVNRDGRIQRVPLTDQGGLAGIAASGDGNLYLIEPLGGRLRRLRPNGVSETVAGNRQFRFGGDGGPAETAVFNAPSGVALDAAGAVFISDTNNWRVRRVDPRGRVSTLIGNGSLGLVQEGVPPLETPLNPPYQSAIDAQGQLHFSVPYAVFRQAPNGRLLSATGFPGQNTGAAGLPARQVHVTEPRGLFFERDGSLLIAEILGGRVRRVDPQGIMRTLAARPAINSPGGVVSDSAGNVFVADPDLRRVFRITSQGDVSPWVGNGEAGIAPAEGQALSIPVAFPWSLALDASGSLLVGYAGGIGRVTADGRWRRIAGNGVTGYAGDGGPAASASLWTVHAMAVDGQGSIYFADRENHRVRKILAQAPRFQVSATSVDLAAPSGGSPVKAQVLATAEVPGLGFTVASNEPWLTVSTANGAAPQLLELTADPARLQPGIHRATLTLRAPLGAPSEIGVAVRFEVGPALPPALRVDRTAVTFTQPRTGGRRSQTLTVFNAGSGELDFNVSVEGAGGLVSVSPARGTATAASPARVNVEANTAGAAVGTYRGTIVIVAGTATVSIPVTVTVSDRDQAMLLTQSGLSFLAVAGGGVIPPQDFGVVNLGTGSMAWRVTTSTLSGGDRWLSTGVRNGSSDAAQSVPTVEVQLDQTGLTPGRYYGLVQVESDGAANSPQVLTVFLEVLPPEATPPSVVQPAELTFRSTAGRSAPGSQELNVYNLTRSSLLYRSVASGGVPVRHAPVDANVEPKQPQRIVVQPLPGTAAPGTYRTALTLQFSDGTVRQVPIAMSIEPQAPARAAEGCAPTQLVAAIVSLGQASAVPAGWPAGVAVEVKDDCGEPLTEGAVTMSFSNGDAPVNLQPLKDGRWHGTWQTRNAAQTKVTVKVEAEDAARAVKGVREVQADLRAAQDPPAVVTEGIVSLAAPSPHAPLAPGALISVYGERLTVNRTESVNASPLPVRLADVEILVAGRRLPLTYASETQVNAVVPPGIAVNTAHQLLVRRGSTYSRPVPVNFAAAQPALFSAMGNQARATVVRGDEQFPNSPASPARGGDVLILYGSGLGDVTPEMDPLRPAESPSPARSEVTVRIGGVNARVLYAGLTPGLVGFYQVNVVVPEEIAGDEVSVTVIVAGQESPAVTVAVRQ